MRPTSFYAQDQWTHNRLTLQGGVRYDHITTTFTGGDRADAPTILPPTTTTPPLGFITSPIVINGPGFTYDDITGRYAATYDLFGTGKTAVKVMLGKYVSAPTGGTPLHPIARAATTATRTWTDDGDFVPECDFGEPPREPGVRGLQQPVLRHGEPERHVRPGLLQRLGPPPVRVGLLDLGAAARSTKGVAVNIGYFRRWFGNFAVTNNTGLTAADFEKFSVTAPSDPRLPGGGGYVVGELYNVTPAKFACSTKTSSSRRRTASAR